MAPSIRKPNVNIELPNKKDLIEGGGGWPLVVDHVETWAWKTGVFSDDELDTIINIGTHNELSKGITNDKTQSDKIRNSHVKFLYPNSLTNWIFSRIAGAIAEINQEFFQFDLHGMDQGLQFTRYTAPGQHYSWHIDRGFLQPTRKLSVSVQLNDPSEYKGGELQFKFGGTDTTVKRERGMVTFFPSYTLHRVKPVTEGTRYSLVVWVGGPPFK